MKKSLFYIFKVFLMLLPFAIVLLLFFLFINSKIPWLPTDLSERGLFGDSFGVLNSLFSGLGFAGLVVTILIQQHQIRQQDKEFQSQLLDTAVRRYEDNLFRLLTLYQDVLHSVISTRNGQTEKGRDVLRDATENVLKHIRLDGVNFVPHAIQERYMSQKLTESDKEVLDYLYFKNFKHLNYNFNRQGRLIESLKALLRHLECNAPAGVQLGAYRNIVASQITHIEISYFFFVALGFKEESELRELLQKSTLIKKASNVYKLQVHRFMYKDFWGHDLRQDKIPTSLPLTPSRIKKILRREKIIKSQLVKEGLQ